MGASNRTNIHGCIHIPYDTRTICNQTTPSLTNRIAPGYRPDRPSKFIRKLCSTKGTTPCRSLHNQQLIGQPAIQRFRIGKRKGLGATSSGHADTMRPLLSTICVRSRILARGSVLQTMCRYCHSPTTCNAPLWANVSIPNAKPLTIVNPASANRVANR